MECAICRSEHDELTRCCRPCKDKKSAAKREWYKRRFHAVYEANRERYCAYARKSYATNAKHRQNVKDAAAAGARKERELHPERSTCRATVYRAIKMGSIVRPGSCLSCGCECKPDAHHADYSKPFLIEWLCKSCHGRANYARSKKEVRYERRVYDAQPVLDRHLSGGCVGN